MHVSRAGVTQLAECLLPKQNVAGSNPVSRSNPALIDELNWAVAEMEALAKREPA